MDRNNQEVTEESTNCKTHQVLNSNKNDQSIQEQPSPKQKYKEPNPK